MANFETDGPNFENEGIPNFETPNFENEGILLKSSLDPHFGGHSRVCQFSRVFWVVGLGLMQQCLQSGRVHTLQIV